MAIPKQIFQTFKSEKLPWLTRMHIKRMLRRNREYTYHFYDDERIEKFLLEEFPREYYVAYKSLTVGAAKADFFRYAILYKKGGIYLDIDCKLISRFRDFVKDSDEAIISIENNGNLYTQWALIFDVGHPFLKRTLELCLINIFEHRYPHDVHQTTGPTVFTHAIKEVLSWIQIHPTEKWEWNTKVISTINTNLQSSSFIKTGKSIGKSNNCRRIL